MSKLINGVHKQDERACSCGCLQSPIDIKHSDTIEMDIQYEINYKPQFMAIEDSGLSIQFTCEQQLSKIRVREVEYHLEQIHFHNLSENMIEGKHYPFEAHLVHRNDEGIMFVVAVMMEVGKANTTLNDCFTAIGNRRVVDPNLLLPTSEEYYHFTGSLTTPPWTLGVDWIIYRNPIELSQEQLNQFKIYYSNNNRSVQPVNNRTIGYQNKEF